MNTRISVSSHWDLPRKTPSKIGEVIGEKYRLVRLIGEGGMGAVYEVQHTVIGQRLALKCLHPSLASDRDRVLRLVREAQAATFIGSDHIIFVADGGFTEDGAPYLVMEYIEGEDLGRMIGRQGALPINRAVEIMLQVCEALEAAHAAGIVHRDLKPDNIALTTRGSTHEWMKILDFGIAKFRPLDEGEIPSASLTETGMAMGTPLYVAPEQVYESKSVDHRADIYSCVVILYELLTATYPFKANNYQKLLYMITSGEPRPIRESRPDIGGDLESIILKAIARDPDDRFQSISELKASGPLPG